MRKELTAEWVREVLRYDPVEGAFYWRNRVPHTNIAAGTRRICFGEARVSEMVERVAKACAPIIEEAVQGGRWPDGTIERVARAAIAAMREPTEAMVSAMLTAHPVNPQTVWKVAVDEALRA